ncbi:MAG: NAD(P)-dependent oxidoreductase [Acidobacteriota bacterium]
MRVLVAGASGAIGRRLIPKLVHAGHAVAGMTHTASKAGQVRAMGADPLIVDALDASAVTAAIRDLRLDAIVHELTAIPAKLNMRKYEQEFVLTNRLRSEGTDNLIAAALQVGVRRFIAQSFAPLVYARQGSSVKTEDDPMDSNPPPALRKTLKAIQHLETATLGIRGVPGIVLRYGAFYGPGTSFGEGGFGLEGLRRRKIPVVGNGAAIWSFIHIDDAAEATLAALEGGDPGIYNIVDDDPAPVSEWLPALAAAINAPPPRHIPAFIARLAVGEHGVTMMNEIRGSSNAKAKRQLGWIPQWPSWKEGFRFGLTENSTSLRQPGVTQSAVSR